MRIALAVGSLQHLRPTTPHTQPLPGITRTRFSLIRYRSPLHTESQLFSSPTGTEMFHFPTSPPHRLCIHLQVTPHNWCWVSPFGHPRINALLATPRGITQPHTSFIGSACQGIHHTPVTKHTDTQTIKVQTPKHKKERYSRPLYSSHTTQPPHTTNHNQRGQPT